MEYATILEKLQEISAFDLYRLHTAIGIMLDDPNRIFQIKKRIQPGDQVEYFEASTHRAVKARVLNFQRSRVLVENLEDKRKFSIPYYALNADIAPQNSDSGIHKSDINTGQMLGFIDRDGQQRQGKVVEINNNTLTLETSQGVWRINFTQVFKLIEQPAAVNDS